MINFSAPINQLSFGNVSVNILLDLFNKGVQVNLFPTQFDLSAFDKVSPEFATWLQENSGRALARYSSKDKGFRIWHIGQSQDKVSDEQSLFTFNECDGLTETEVNILNNQKNVFVSSPYAKEVFETSGVKNVTYVPLGFDSLHFHRLNKRLVPENIISFGLLGKWEKRKSTTEVLKLWAKKYGNNPNYMLQAAVYNPFFNPEQNKALIAQALEGKVYNNINFLPFVKTNSEYNQVLNAIDIILGMSKSEGFGLPEFQCVALGKHAVIHNVSGYKAWADESNAVLVDPTGKDNVYDGVFFHPNQPFNQGSYFTWNENDFLTACEIAEEKFKKNPINEAGLNLQTEFTWEKTTDQILAKL